MKSLALDLDSGRLSLWPGHPRPLDQWSDRYGDMYTLRVQIYRGGGGKVPSCAVQFLVKKPRRLDAQAIWKLATFARVPGNIAPSSLSYVGQVDVTGKSYREVLKLDASPGNDLASVDLLGVLRVVAGDRIVEAEFSYQLVNSAYRAVDIDLGAVYVGLSDTGGILVRNVDGDEWRELTVTGAAGAASFALGETVLGPVDTLSVSDDFVRVSNGVLQIKHDNTNQWVNVLLRGAGGTTLALGETPPVGFTLSNDRFKVADDGRLLLRNLTTGNWHEARVQTGDTANTFALGTEYDDSQV